MWTEQIVSGIYLVREKDDKALSHERQVTQHLCRLLNASGFRRWKRFYPYRHGLTACRQGVHTVDYGYGYNDQDYLTSDDGYDEVVYWHERYQVEAAHKAFNAGRVFFLCSRFQVTYGYDDADFAIK